MSRSRKLFPDFGDPSAADDIARSSIEAAHLFVDTEAAAPFLDRQSRSTCIFGAKGSGKTLLLWKKRQQVAELQGTQLFPQHPQAAYKPTNDFASTVRYANFYQLDGNGGNSNSATWTALWEWALLRSLSAAWMESPPEEASESTLSQLADGLASDGYTQHADYPLTDPFELLHDFFARIEVETQRGVLRTPRLGKLRHVVRKLYSSFPPTYLFIDNQDDFYEENPDFWIGSSIGALGAAAELRELTNHRVHVFLSLRPEVVLRLRRSERYGKLIGRLVELKWRDSELLDFFFRRVKVLRPDKLQNPELSANNPIAALLGRALMPPGASEPVIFNRRTSQPGNLVSEPASSYLLRHTLRRPRDLITLGNILLNRMSEAQYPGAVTRANAVREAVAQAATEISAGYLAEVERLWPWRDIPGCAIRDFASHFVRKNILTKMEARPIRDSFAKAASDPKADPFSVLMCLGLVGYPSVVNSGGELTQYFRDAGTIDLEDTVPETVEWLLLHPILYSAEIMPVKGINVAPGQPFDPHRIEVEARIEVTRAETSGNRAGHVFSWIHVSDLHFGAGSRSHQIDRQAVTRALVRDIEQVQVGPWDAVFVTGDISFSAQPKQFEAARRWLLQLAAAAKLGEGQVHMVPGNHDVRRDLVESDPFASLLHTGIREEPGKLDTFLADAETRDRLHRKLASYVEFANSFGAAAEQDLSDGLDWHRVVELDGLGGSGRIRLVGLNSVAVSDKDDGGPKPFVPNMVIARSQLDRTLGRCGDDDLVILLTHHPRNWMSPPSVQLFNQYTARPTCVHLCGHVHLMSAESTQGFYKPSQAVTLIAGATHGDDDVESEHSYSIGALRYNERRKAWELGVKQRVFLRDQDRFGRRAGVEGPEEFQWRLLDLKWGPPLRKNRR